MITDKELKKQGYDVWVKRKAIWCSFEDAYTVGYREAEKVGEARMKAFAEKVSEYVHGGFGDNDRAIDFYKDLQLALGQTEAES